MSEEIIPNIVHVERSVLEQIVSHTMLHSKNEWGGLLIGREEEGEMHCIAAVLPPQKTQSPGYCEFRRELFPIIRNALDAIENTFNDENFHIISWIHTHPNLGVFFSGTDQKTYGDLVKLNPALSAVVIDPVQYEWLAINSKPGNQDGFSRIELNLDHLYDFNAPDQSLIEKLKLFKEQINSERNRKLFNLKESEKINVFIPIPLKVLKNQIITSGLNHLKDTLQEVSNKLFSIESELKIKEFEEKNPEIEEIINYSSHFRAFNQEMRKWNISSVGKKIFDYDLLLLSQYNPESNILSIINVLNKIAKNLNFIPVTQMTIWYKYFQYSNPYFSDRVEWSSIRNFEIDESERFGRFYIISYKTGLFSKYKRLLFFDIHYSELFIKAIMSRVQIKFDKNEKLISKLDDYITLQNKLVKKEKEKKIRAEKIKKEADKNLKDEKPINKDDLTKNNEKEIKLSEKGTESAEQIDKEIDNDK